MKSSQFNRKTSFFSAISVSNSVSDMSNKPLEKDPISSNGKNYLFIYSIKYSLYIETEMKCSTTRPIIPSVTRTDQT